MIPKPGERDLMFEEYKQKIKLLAKLSKLENMLEELGCDFGEEISNNKLFDKSLFIAHRELDSVYNEIIKDGNRILKKLEII